MAQSDPIVLYNLRIALVLRPIEGKAVMAGRLAVAEVRMAPAVADTAGVVVI